MSSIFNILPGTGLGFTGNKQIALGLGVVGANIPPIGNNRRAGSMSLARGKSRRYRCSRRGRR